MRLLWWSILLFSMWLVLSASLDMANILIGLGVSIAVALLYTKMFKHTKFEFINPIWFLVYIFILLKNIIISNVQIAKRTLSKDMKLAPAIIKVKTNLKSDWKKLLLANSITLTPGTLTLDIVDDTLFIHVIEFRDSDNKEAITQEFEDIILKM